MKPTTTRHVEIYREISIQVEVVTEPGEPIVVVGATADVSPWNGGTIELTDEEKFTAAQVAEADDLVAMSDHHPSPQDRVLRERDNLLVALQGMVDAMGADLCDLQIAKLVAKAAIAQVNGGAR